MNIINHFDYLIRILRDYERLLNQSPIRESVLQDYLSTYRIILDPWAQNVHRKRRLGSEYVTDFIIETYDGNYKLVEIEKPIDQLYLNNGNPSSTLTHAEQQVLDWQGWVRRNIAYLRHEANLMMNEPEGLVIIGLHSQMNTDDIRKLNERNLNMRGRLQIITFDFLSMRLRQLIDNITEQASYLTNPMIRRD
jgi:hypothetical protein